MTAAARRFNRHQRRAAQAAAGRRVIRHAAIVVSPTDVTTMHAIEKFIVAYDGGDLLHDIELNFPGASYRAFYLALSRSRDAIRWFDAEGSA